MFFAQGLLHFINCHLLVAEGYRQFYIKPVDTTLHIQIGDRLMRVDAHLFQVFVTDDLYILLLEGIHKMEIPTAFQCFCSQQKEGLGFAALLHRRVQVTQ
ncbi:hypothetical protein D3C87_1333920 [compost metagenome]